MAHHLSTHAPVSISVEISLHILSTIKFQLSFINIGSDVPNRKPIAYSNNNNNNDNNNNNNNRNNNNAEINYKY